MGGGDKKKDQHAITSRRKGGEGIKMMEMERREYTAKEVKN